MTKKKQDQSFSSARQSKEKTCGCAPGLDAEACAVDQELYELTDKLDEPKPCPCECHSRHPQLERARG